MRVIVFFDLPTSTKRERKNYTIFKRYLLNNGFHMLQYSVYNKICNGHDSVKKKVKDLKANLPPTGSVKVLTLTENQYIGMEVLVSEDIKFEEEIGDSKLIIILKNGR